MEARATMGVPQNRHLALIIMSRLRNLRTFLTNSGVRNAYMKWWFQRLLGHEPSLVLPNGLRCYGSAKFNDFCMLKSQGIDPTDFAVFRHFLKDGGVFFDVGANVGVTTLVAAGTAQLARIVAFEPTHKCAELWHKNVGKNGIPNASLLQCAVSDKVGTMEFITDPSALAYNRLNVGKTMTRHDSGDNHQPDVTMVNVTTLDAVCEAFNLDGISLLKIDVEGAEPSVWRGARRLLEEKAIKAVFMEFVPAFFCDMNEDIHAFTMSIHAFGYAAFEIDRVQGIGRRLSQAELAAGSFAGPNIVLQPVDR